MPARASIAVAATEMPNKPALRYATTIAAQITSTGSAVDSIDTANPWMTLVPWPVSDASAIVRTGR